MTPISGRPARIIIVALIGTGFAGLIGAHEFAVWPGSGSDPNGIVPFVLAAAGTIAFVAAGILAVRQLRGGAPR
jgi:hypothetical protein